MMLKYFPQSSVDSIRWVRPDSIILGCFQLTDDGNEENYLVQVIKSKEGKFSDVCISLSTLKYWHIFVFICYYISIQDLIR